MKWEYRIIKVEAKGLAGGKFDHNEFEQLMNDLGNQGWELVNVFGNCQVK